jgi:Tol biopolymer transport system component
MTISAPPRPPQSNDPVDRNEFEVLEALIEEARQRARRRRRTYGAVVVLVALTGAAVFAVIERTTAKAAHSQSASSPSAAGATLPAGTIALTGSSGPRILLWTRRGLHDPDIKGRAFGWSPDGSRLLVSRLDGVLYSARADGSTDIRLPHRGDAYNAAWSPDGAQVAFEGAARNGAAAYRTIYVVGANGSGLHQLPGRPVAAGRTWTTGNLAWSPDGTQIVFAGRGTQEDSRRWLYEVPADGGGSPRPLVIGAHVVAPLQPSWSPNGSKLAFTVEQNRGSGIYVMRVDGTDVRRIAAGGHGTVWSPDGSMIAYRTNGYEFKDKGLHAYGGNWIVHADGTHRVALPPSSHAGFSWSPDSKLIAFVGTTPGDILVVRPNGTGVVRILHKPGSDYILPLWQHGTASTETN